MAQNKKKMSQFYLCSVEQMLQAGAYVPVVTLPTKDPQTGDAVPGQNYLVSVADLVKEIAKLVKAMGGSGD